MCSFENIAKETMDLLNNNTEWIDRYSSYADDIISRIDIIKKAKSMFRCRKPFGVYISTSNAKDGVNVVRFSLRYKGQHIAELNVNAAKGTVTINTDSKTVKSNIEQFGFDRVLSNAPWQSEEAKELRNFFLKKSPYKDNHIEHMLESLILGELLKKHKTKLRGIKPVQIGGVRYSMPTPLKASGTSVEYSAQYGGGIDIFTRCRIASEVRLNVMELKDENIKAEPPEKVIKQAIKYAVFIQYLLRSKSGKKWWKLFGFSRTLPEHITINATCLMPVGYCNDKSFANKTIDVNGDTIELHYIYFTGDYNNEVLKVVDSSI